MTGNTVTVEVSNGPTIIVPWTSGMNAQQAIEAAFNAQGSPGEFTYSLQYFGSQFGYLVLMINETYESFMSSADPFYFWEFMVNGQPAQTGIDNTILNAGDTVTFELQVYDPTTHTSSTVGAKYKARLRAKQ
ncbi:MAG TPA: DUF4430 domain-containing protein [Blastocatellia bacterium]|nr:DUF4430 domain-containing protein [Blastocatellia bacterium]